MKSYFLTSLHCTTYLYVSVASPMLVRCQNSSRRTTENIHPPGSTKATEAYVWLCVGRWASPAPVFWGLKHQLCMFSTSAIRMAKKLSYMPPKIVLRSHRPVLNHHLRGDCAVWIRVIVTWGKMDCTLWIMGEWKWFWYIETFTEIPPKITSSGCLDSETTMLSA